MRHWLNRKTFHLLLTAGMLATFVLSFASTPLVQAAAPVVVAVPVNKGWAKFSWAPTVRGPFAFSVVYTSIDRTLLTVPTRLAFAVGANVACPAQGDAHVGVRVYDFGQLIQSTTYTVKCPAAPAARYPTAKGGDDYANDPHYFHGSVPIATGGAHNLVVETDLATTDRLFWAYVRADAAPGVPGKVDIGSGAIALTVENPPANAWVEVQWLGPDGQTWNPVPSWSGPLVLTPEGRMAHWVEAAQYGTGPYRWAVYDRDPQQGGQLWGVSDPFTFPRQAGDWVWTKVAKSAGLMK